MSATPTELSIVLGSYPHTAKLKSGEIASPAVKLNFTEFKPANRAFKPMVREQRFDVCELAIVTYLQAKAYNKPLTLLPAVMVGRFQQPFIFYNAERGTIGPADLPGRRVGVRAYTQTTGAWLRGILAQDHGVDLDKVTWVTNEDPHLAEYKDPDGIERMPDDTKLEALLLDGKIDAIIGEMPDDPRFRPLIPHPMDAAKRWYDKHKVAPVNHMVVVKQDFLKAHPDAVREVFRLLSEAKRAAGPQLSNGVDMNQFGVEANRAALEMIIDFSVRQRLIPRRVSVDELFDDTTRGLGA